GLKILGPARGVRVRFPPPAPHSTNEYGDGSAPGHRQPRTGSVEADVPARSAAGDCLDDAVHLDARRAQCAELTKLTSRTLRRCATPAAVRWRADAGTNCPSSSSCFESDSHWSRCTHR